MSKTKLEIDMPSELLFLLCETEETFKEKVKLWLATKMFEEGKLSLGQAAEFAGYSKTAFSEILGKNKVLIFNYPIEELEEDVVNNADVWIGEDLYEEVLKLCGEYGGETT